MGSARLPAVSGFRSSVPPNIFFKGTRVQRFGLMASARVFPLLLLLVAAPILAGCTEAPPPAAPPADPGPALSTFTDCPWTYFDGSPVDCTPPPTIPIEGSVPPGWVCLGEDPREGWSLHWDPTTDERGVFYSVDVNASEFHGVMRFKTNEQIGLFTFPNASDSGFLRIPMDFGPNATFRFLVYSYGYAWNGTGLAGAEADELWSLHDDQFWVVHRLTTGNGTYTFQGMDSRNTTKRTAEGEQTIAFHEPGTYFIRGSDFRFSAVYESLHFGRALQGVDTVGIDRQCQLSGVL